MTDFVTVKTVANIDGSDYQYAERKGKDSVAFILYSPKEDRFGIINEFKPPIGEYMITAFGGSLDVDIGPHKSTGWDDKATKRKVRGLAGLVQMETEEEAGYSVEMQNILPVGRAFVSTQMNQFCHLYVVLVDDVFRQFIGRNPQSKGEEATRVIWRTRQQIMKGEDWKSIMILTRFNERKVPAND